jgi:hypothetical protein
MASIEELRQELIRMNMVSSAPYVRYRLPVGHPESQRISRCGEVDGWENVRRCNSPFCETCRKKMIRKEQGVALEFFAGLENEELAQLTILMDVIPCLAECLDETIKKHKTRLRNWIGRMRRRDPRWNTVRLRGFWEVEPIRVSEWDEMSDLKRRTLSDLSMPVVTGRETVWLPHLHATVALGDMSAKEFGNALREAGYQGSRQVEVQPFYRTRKVTSNLRSTVQYHVKVDIRNKDEAGEYVWWGDRDIRELADWFGSKTRSGYEAIRFQIYGAGMRLKKSASRSEDNGESSGIVKADSVEACVETSSVMSGKETGNETGIRDSYYILTTGLDRKDIEVQSVNRLGLPPDGWRIGRITQKGCWHEMV